MVLDIEGSNALIFDNNIYVSNGSIIRKYSPEIRILSETDLFYTIIDLAYKPPYIYIMGNYDITVLDSNLGIISNFHDETLNPFENFLIAKNENSIFAANRYRAFKINMDTLTIVWSVDYPVCYGNAFYNTLASTISLDDADNFYTSIQRFDTCSRYRIFYPNGTMKRDIGYNTAGNYHTEPIILSDTHYFIGMNTGSGGTAPKPIYGYNRATDALEYSLSANNYHLCMFYDNNRIYTCSANSSIFGYYDLADSSFTALGSSPFWFNTRSFMTASMSTLYTGIYIYNPYSPGEISGNNILYNFGDAASNIYSNNGGFKMAVGGNYKHSPIEFYNGTINYLNKQDSYNGLFPYDIAILNMGNNILRLNISPLIVTVSTVPDQINSGDISQISVHVTDENGLAIDNVDIALSVTEGNLIPIAGLTDVNGDFISIYTSPIVTTSQIFTISAIATKTGYADGIGSAQITVNPPVLVLTSIEVIPPDANIIIGDTQQFTAICRDQNNNVMNCPIIIWSVSDTSKGIITETGLFTGVAEGSTIVRAMGDTVEGTASVTIIPPPSVLTSIDIIPSSINIAVGDTQQFTTICRDQNDNVMDCPVVVWNTSDTGIGIIDSTGLFTGIVEGSVTVRATSDIVEGTAAVTIIPPPPALTSIEMIPPSANIFVGNTQQFTAICRDQNDNVMDCPTITWSTSDTGIGIIDSTGLFTGIAEGSVTVIATGDDIIETAVVTVAPMVQAGLSSTAGAILLGGLLIGTLFIPKICKGNTREACEKEGCKWINGKCVKR